MIAVECFADEAVVRLCGFSLTLIKHDHGRGNVVNLLKKATKAAIGVVDEDPGRNNTSALMKELEEVIKVGSLRLMLLQGSQDKRLVVICPRLEDWLLARADASGVRPDDYGLPGNPRALHARWHYERHPRFRDFVKALLAADPEMQQLKSWLSEGN
jgi:hypothetical protein